MSTTEEIRKVISEIKFTLISPNETRKLSAVEIQTADTYDEDGVPIVSGLMDGRLGTLEPRQKCSTCGNTAVACPGHFGHIELAEPVVHVIFSKLIQKLLSATCRSCGRIMLTKKKIEDYSAKLEDMKKRLDTVPRSFYDNAMKDAKKSQDCPHCGATRYPIEHIKPTSYHEIIDGGANKLFPTAIRERFERITDEDLVLLGMNPAAARPEWTILQVMPVAPVTVRPSITLESGIRSEDDLTHKLVDIIRINQKLREARESGVPVNIIQELHDLLQYHVTTYFDNEVSGLPPARHRSGRALRTICQRLKGKEGRFRGNLSGKRVDFSARTVISPDPNLDINEVGVPVDIAMRLTMPEKVSPWNIGTMKKLIEKGPDDYPGALYIARPDGRKIRLEFVTDRSAAAESLEPGFIVERHIRDGDIVLFNRQPSLHRMSIMAHKVKVLPHKTFRLNPCVCPPYNADFDGDEMNLHVLQGEEARTEATLLMQVQDQILSPRYGGPIIGAVTDHLTASYLLTKDHTWLNEDEVCHLLVAGGYAGDIPKPDKTKPEKLWSGKTIFSLFLPKKLNFVFKSNICRKCDKCKQEKCPYDSYIVIKNGVLQMGVIDRNAIGKERSDSLFHRIVKDYGAEDGRIFLDSMSRLLDRFITMRGFSYGIADLDLSPLVRNNISKAIQKAEDHVGELVEEYKNVKLERLPGQSLEESLEIYIMNELSRARDEAGNIADEYLGLDSSGAIMARVRDKGSMLNVGQMTACVGQQSIRGKRILRGYRGRTLSFFEPGDVGAEPRGFVYASFGSGLNPKEYFFHAMGGREGLVDTAVRTQQSGYMQRRVINALEHVRVEYDGTVRDSKGSIIQFLYGEDGVDTAKSDHGRAVNIERLIESIKLGSARGRAISKPAAARLVQDKTSQLSPLLADELKKQLGESGLTQKAASEVVDKAIESYNRSLIEPGEAAGIVSAQSIGEPGTQMTLRTFHFAGVKEQNVTLGLPRLIEIVDARKIPSTPMMTVYLDKKHRVDRASAEEVAAELTYTTLGDIAQTIESEITKSRFIVTLDPQRVKDRAVTPREIKEALGTLGCDTTIEKTQIEIRSADLEIGQFKRLATKLASTRVKGLPAVKRALVIEEEGEWLIRTEGSALKLALTTNGVDSTRTISNSIHEVASVLGIEAARSVIVKEAMSVLEEQGLDVDIRHIMLLSDAMTNTGEVLQVGRHGISGEKTSTLAKAAFEITIPTIVDAAVKAISDPLKGVAENVIVGQQVPMGTGLIDMYMSVRKGK